MKYYNERTETIEREELSKIQNERLIDLVKRCYKNVPFYRNKLTEAGINPDTFGGLGEIEKLPFTVKKDLRDNYPYGLFAVPRSEIVRVHASSGTTGKPTVVGYTRQDLNVWAEIMARSIVAAGGSADDVIQISYGYGLFTGGMGAHLGSEKLGAITVPTSTGNTQRQIMLMKDLGTNILCCTPSYAIVIAEELEREGHNIKDFALKAGIFGAEPWGDKMREEIEGKLGIHAHDIYGLSEIMGPGVAIECEAHDGLHIQEDHFIPEIIDPETLKVLPDGEEGELVISTVTKQGLPLIRYRTGDLTSLTREKCRCGRTLARIARIKARTDDMLIVRGVNVFPSQVQTVLAKYPELSSHFVIKLKKIGALDYMGVSVELKPNVEVNLGELQHRIAKDLSSALFLSCELELAAPFTLGRTEGKFKRVIDEREE